MKLTIDTVEHEPDALFMRREIASGTSEDGTEIEVSLSGASLILQHRRRGETRTVHSVSISDLLMKWARALDEPEGEAHRHWPASTIATHIAESIQPTGDDTSYGALVDALKLAAQYARGEA